MNWTIIAAIYCTACAALAYGWMRSARAWARRAQRWSGQFDQAVTDWYAARRTDTEA